ncbi:MAG: YdcF family protein [Thermoguttaceae bacterium]|nr:YdcF family protein [Thermoguttaceae bacterium]
MDILYSLATYLVEPYTLLLLLLWMSVLWMVFRSEPVRGKGCVVAALLLLTVASMPISAFLLGWPLESAYPYQRSRPEQAQVIVVLGGGQRLLDPDRPRLFPAEDTVERCVYAADLYHSGQPLPILVTGGFLAPLHEEGPPLAQTMADFLSLLGVRRQDLLLEIQSTNTYENALFAAELLRKHGWNQIILVTEPLHMHRARLAFEKQGIQVYPAPSRPSTESFEWSWEYFAPSVGGLALLKRAAHEWIGLLWYKLNGRI